MYMLIYTYIYRYVYICVCVYTYVCLCDVVSIRNSHSIQERAKIVGV